MPVYAYKGIDAGGKTVTGTRDADNPRTIKQVLRRDGVFVTELKESGGKAKKAAGGTKAKREFRLWSKGVSTQELAVATRQLATLLGAGIPLVQSLNALIDQVEDEHQKMIWSDVKQRVNEGAGFGDALATYPKIFSSLYVNMIRAGESSGAMDIVLNRLADFTEGQADLRSKLIGSMIYPVIMIFVAMIVTAILFIKVVPQISKVFESQKLVLPLPTRVVIAVSEFTSVWWPALIVVAILAAIGFRQYIRSERGRPKWDKFVLRSPVFGPLVRMVAVTRFARTLSTLLASGVPMLAAFDIVKNVVQNHVLAEVIEKVRESVKEGESVAQPLKRSGEFPPIVTHMVSVGEKSGELESMLETVARSYEVQVEARVRVLTTVLEPVMIVVLGVVVAVIMLAVLLPMQQLGSNI